MSWLPPSIALLRAYLIAALFVAIAGDLYGLELALVVAAYFLVKAVPGLGRRFFERVEAAGCRLAERKVAACLAIAGACLALRIAMLPFIGVPHPVIADEFSHLLLADTFAHGRLSNAPHPLWRSFETLHEIQQPTYSSMYFPGPAILLWLGQMAAGLPWLGVLVGTSALCGLICWALQGWLPARWAFLGGSLAMLRIGLTSYWMNSYWGGAFAAIGGTLVLGALPRLERRAGVGMALTMAVGIAMLGTSRPYEGLMFCVPIAVRLIGWLLERKGASFTSKVVRVVAPMALCLALAGAGLGLYFNAVTGSPTHLPYVINQERYGWPMTLPWTDVRYVKHDRREFDDYYMYEMNERLYFTSWDRFLAGTAIRLEYDWRFYVGPALTIPLFFIGPICRSRRLRMLLLTGGVVIFTTYLEPHFPHYMAPATLPIIAVLVEGFRHLRLYRPGGLDVGLRLSRTIPVVLIAVIAVRVAAEPLHFSYHQKFGGYTSWCCSDAGVVDQQSVVQQLPREGKHLVMVRYHNDHYWQEQWVFNEADIDQARVVWARELGGEQDRKLLEYFKDRQVWLLEPDVKPVRLKPYRASERPAPAAN